MKMFSAKKYFCLALTLATTSCASAPLPSSYDIPERHFTDPAEKAYADKEFAVYDPAESANKEVYKFNAELDKYVLIPIVDAYKYVTPEVLRKGVQNFFLNVGEVNNFGNAVLQLHPEQATATVLRFTINSTVGLLGTVDVATYWGIKRAPADFGETLGRWGTAPGAYVVLPVLGPSNVRDTIGKAVDYATLTIIIPEHIQNSVPYEVIAYGVQPLNGRYSNNFRYYSSGSPFEYELVRYIVNQTRELQIQKSRQP